MAKIDGADYRPLPHHPRHPEVPLVVTSKGGEVLVKGGQKSCAQVTDQKLLRSMIRSGYIVKKKPSELTEKTKTKARR